VLHQLTPANKAKRAKDARTLLQALRSDPEKRFAHITTAGKSWLYDSYESSTMFGHRRDKVTSRVSQTINSKKVMITVFRRHSIAEVCTFASGVEMQ
jgi:hypothetical protein